MGQKVNPTGFRLGVLVPWGSRWFAGTGKYAGLLKEDLTIRDILMKKLRPAGISQIEIERAVNKTKIILHVTRPGVMIGKGGSGLLELKKFIMATLKIKDENSEYSCCRKVGIKFL